MSVTMTPDAADRIQSFIVNRGKGLGLRLGIKTTGCSGLAYVMEFVDELNEDDTLFSISDVNIIIDGKSLVYLDGIEVDFVKEGLNEGFKFTNPNAKGECGCGESFNV
ncbi:MAG: iron-sulfur cluster assembly protein IscA [Colwellia sp.]|jgi:iron-sulfur cluster assembly protein|nr:iron-sulfur cluster assembly protein IscA [Colwellia sp.]